jgi:hypothetical protein
MRIVAWTTTTDATVVMIFTGDAGYGRYRRTIVIRSSAILVTVLNASGRCGITVKMDRIRREVALWIIGIVFIVLNAGGRCGIISEKHRTRRGIVAWTTAVVVAILNTSGR